MKTALSLSSLLLGASLASAQAPANASPAQEPVNLENFVVTASPFQRAQDEVAQPTSVLAGQRLTLARQTTLGETLANEPGISSTAFGPGASRPVIRGLGGDRIRVLQGGIGTLDASVVSPDHAVSLDPLLVQRIEIVRGPATLLYGGAAIGGVVNVIDYRLPEELPAAALSSRFETRYGSAAGERAVAGALSGKTDRVAWHFDGFSRNTDDLRIPGFAETRAIRAVHVAKGETPARDRLPNSATESSGGGVGATYFADQGHVGVSYSGFETLYGVPGSDHGDVQIDLKQRRWDVHGELPEPFAGFTLAKLQFGLADYRHAELEDGDVGTRFTNDAYEGRLELQHAPLGIFTGAIGAQVTRSDLAVVGDEAFIPTSVTENRALFVFEEAVRGAFTWQLGARVEDQEITPDRASKLAARSHTGVSFSGGVIWKLAPAWSLALSGSRSERAPNTQELFADGPHAGTGTYEIGDSRLGVERSHGLDLSLRKRSGSLTGVATVFLTQFDGYIFEDATGAVKDDLPVFRFVQRDARFVGGEVELIAHLHESTGHAFDLRFVGDVVRATNTTSNEALPRITPMRTGVGLDYRVGAWSFSTDLRHGFKQDRVAHDETPTDSYTTLGASVAWRFPLGRAEGELFLRGSNLTDETVRVHASFLKDVAPLAGRDFTAGVRLAF
jgi:iron complex outermembrane receptor protein